MSLLRRALLAPWIAVVVGLLLGGAAHPARVSLAGIESVPRVPQQAPAPPVADPADAPSEAQEMDDEERIYRGDDSVVPLPDDLPPLPHSGEARIEQVIDDYREQLLADPQDVTVLNDLGTILAQTGRFAEAEEHFRTILKLKPELTAAHVNLGAVYYETGRLDEAVTACQNALELQPDNCDARINMGLAFMRQGKLAEGLQVLREACQPCPDNLRLLESLSWVLAIAPDPQLRDGAEALRLAERLIRLAKRMSVDGSLNPRKLDVLAAAQARAGKYELAAGNAEAAILRANARGNHALAAEIQQRLELYKQGRPYEVAP